MKSNFKFHNVSFLNFFFFFKCCLEEKKKGWLFIKMESGRLSKCGLCHNATHTHDRPSFLQPHSVCQTETTASSGIEQSFSCLCVIPSLHRAVNLLTSGTSIAEVEQSSAIKSSLPQKWVCVKANKGLTLDSTRST